MEQLINQIQVLPHVPAISLNGEEKSSSSQPFIEANTKPIHIKEIRDENIIPVYTATNEPLISHGELIETTWKCVHNYFKGEQILQPSIRVSHPIKGRIPEARNKKASELLPHETTLYYERAMFVIEIPSITANINGNRLNLIIGAVKAYNHDSLHSKRSSQLQNFKLFIGFQNKVCCNMCVSSDGLVIDSKVCDVYQLEKLIMKMFEEYNAKTHLEYMQNLSQYSLSEHEFATLIGRARMHKHLSDSSKSEISPLMFGDQQLGALVKDYYNDENFSNSNHEINLWKVFNLFTGVNKSSYIDTFIERSVNATDIVHDILEHKQGIRKSWYLS